MVKFKCFGFCIVLICLFCFSSPAFSAEEPQGSVHFDPQNTDLSDQTISISSPYEYWTNQEQCPDGNDMVGVGVGLALSEYRYHDAVFATVYSYEESEFHYYVRKISYGIGGSLGGKLWDYPCENSFFSGFASYSVPLVVKENDSIHFYFGDDDEIHNWKEVSGSPSVENTWDTSDYGTPYGFHEGYDYKVVTATTDGYVLLIDGSDLAVHEMVTSEPGHNWITYNSVAVSPDNGSYVYVLTNNADPASDSSRLYMFDITGESIQENAHFDYEADPKKSEGSPMVIEKSDDINFIFYDISMAAGTGEHEHLVCLEHDRDAQPNTLTEQWKYKVDNAREGYDDNIIASPAYGPLYIDGNWHDVVWIFLKRTNKLYGIAVNEKTGTPSWNEGEELADLTIDTPSDTLSNYKIVSALSISRDTSQGNESTYGIFSMCQKTGTTLNAYLVNVELEKKSGEQNPEWIYELPDPGVDIPAFKGVSHGQFIITPDDQSLHQVIVGQRRGSVISIREEP